METRVETSAITIANPDVLASARLDLQRALDRGRYPSREAWARVVLAEDDPVDLYEQRDGSLHLLDGNHRYLAATILGVPLVARVHRSERRTNPAWVDAALTEAWPALQASLAPPIVTKKGKKQHAEELGCGHYGCVLATSRPDVVLKVTTDPTEAAIVTLLLRHRDLQQDGIVRYLEVQKLPGERRGRALFAIWREAAYDVGDVVPLGRSETRDARDARYRLNRFKAWANEVRMTLGRQADPWPLLAEAQRPVTQARARNYVDLAEGDVYGDPFPRKTDPWASARYGGGGRIEDAVVIKHWPIREQPLKLAVLLHALEQTAQFLGSNREAYLVGQALENLLDQGVLLADVHANNIGRVNRPDHEGAVVITDPGHAVFLRRDLAEEAVAIAGAAAGTASKPKRAMNPAERRPNDGGLGELGAAALVVGAMLPIVPPPGPGDLLTPLIVGGWVAHHHAHDPPAHPHHARQTNPRRDDFDLAVELRDYLNQVPQPEDFPYLIRDWSGDEEDYRDLDELDDEERAAFAKWLAKSDAMRLELREVPHEVPAYVFFRDAKALGENAWCVHFTNAQAFDAFDRGANLAMLALSTHYRRKETARCDVNLDDETPIEDRVYAFAYPAKDVSTPEGAARGWRRYGRNAVLFQTDAAVSAFHITDKERQALFPVCSERNLHAVRFEDDRVVLLGRDGQDVQAFPTLPALIKHLNAQQRKAAKRSPR